MALANIFSNNMLNNVKLISRDSKIYEAFKPYLADVLGISLEEFMSNKELRYTYRQKYSTIKSKFQEQVKGSLKDEECLTRIAAYGKEWEEFISTARENTIDAGESFIKSTPLDSYILMSSNQRASLEQRLINAAIERVRTYTQDNNISSPTSQLNEMMEEQLDPITNQESHKMKG